MTQEQSDALAQALQGRYIAIEGIDGAGKTTIVGLLDKWLAERNVMSVSIREPGTTPFSEEVRRMLKAGFAPNRDEEFLLMTAARVNTLRYARREQKARAVNGQCAIVADRCFVSSLAYQAWAGAPQGTDAVATAAKYYQITASMLPAGLMLPDAIVYLKIDPTLRFNPQDKIESRGVPYRKAVADGYDYVAKSLQEVFVTVDANTTDIAATFNNVLAALYAKFVK